MDVRVTLALALSLSLGACAADVEPEETASNEEEIGSAPRMQLDPGAKRPTRYPIVLHHGFSASGTGVFSFNHVKETLEADGHVVLTTDVPPFNSIEVRTKVLVEYIDQARELCAKRDSCDPSRVNLIAHSMGGLDARHAISALGYGDRVASLTTVGTPHRGTPVADAALGLLPGLLDPALNALASILGRVLTEDELANDSQLRASLEDLSQRSAADFEREHPDDRRVHYQSWAGLSSALGLPSSGDESACGRWLSYRGRRAHSHPAFYFSAPIAAGLSLKPNDGLIPVESTKWGTFRGCVPADHGDLVGQPNHDDYDAWTGFDHLVFYRNIAFDLARSGF